MRYLSTICVGLLWACGCSSSTTPVGATPEGAQGGAAGAGTGGQSAASTGGASGAAGMGGGLAAGSGGAPSAGGAGAGGAGAAGAPGGTVFTVVFENHDYKEIVGSSDAPYINTLIQTYGLATNYKDSAVHPSLPNYLYMISGDTQFPGGYDPPPTLSPFPIAADNLGSQLTKAGVPWRAYQEDMGKPCNLKVAGHYAPKHNPFVYFMDLQADASRCASVDVDYASNFAADLAAGTYRYMWITPNLVNDGHDPYDDPPKGMKQTDAWASTEIPKILASDAYKNGGVLFITWDEAEGRSGDDPEQIPMIVVSPTIKAAGFTSAAAYSHASYLATVEDMFKLPRLGAAKTASPLFEFFQ